MAFNPEMRSRHINPLNAKLNPICHLLALLGAHHILHVSRIRVKCQCFRTVAYLAEVSVGAAWGCTVGSAPLEMKKILFSALSKFEIAEPNKRKIDK